MLIFFNSMVNDGFNNASSNCDPHRIITEIVQICASEQLASLATWILWISQQQVMVIKRNVPTILTTGMMAICLLAK